MDKTKARKIHKPSPQRAAYNKNQNTLEKLFLGGIGSFLLVLLFPNGVRYFFKNMFAGIVSGLVTIILAGLLTEKLFNKVSQNKRS